MLGSLRQGWLWALCLITISCATYYQLNYEFNERYASGDVESASKLLDANKKQSKDKNRFLYFVNQGLVKAQLGEYEESNNWFEQAYLFGEDYRRSPAQVATSFLVNPNTLDYPGEDHEHLLLLYYKAINFLKLEDYESALVECRRLNNRLLELSDKYQSENKYRRDAFVHNLMGIIYEASGDINNAFIAYRNSYEIYAEDYAKLFNLGPPEQLKHDLLRSAYLNGFLAELDMYERDFGIQFDKSSLATQELVFFWHNGLGPVKSEWSINFSVVEGELGVISFVNEEFGFDFPFPINDDQQRSELTNLRFFRVAFPKYTERGVFFDQGSLKINDKNYSLQIAENVNDVAFKVLDERMVKEFGQALLRVAIKKSIEQAIRGEQRGGDSEGDDDNEGFREGLSFIVGILNAATEKADTRNWQTLPHSIFYARAPLDTGHNKVILRVSSNQMGSKDDFVFAFDAEKEETVFHTFHTLEARR